MKRTRRQRQPSNATVKRRVVHVLHRAKHADLIRRCIETAATQAGCTWQEVMSPNRGTKAAAGARVAAMHACVVMGVPVQVTAKAFRRKRWTVQEALKLGREGRESRDIALLQAFREVVKAVQACENSRA